MSLSCWYFEDCWRLVGERSTAVHESACILYALILVYLIRVLTLSFCQRIIKPAVTSTWFASIWNQLVAYVPLAIVGASWKVTAITRDCHWSFCSSVKDKLVRQHVTRSSAYLGRYLMRAAVFMSKKKLRMTLRINIKYLPVRTLHSNMHNQQCDQLRLIFRVGRSRCVI